MKIQLLWNGKASRENIISYISDVTEEVKEDG